MSSAKILPLVVPVWSSLLYMASLLIAFSLYVPVFDCPRRPVIRYETVRVIVEERRRWGGVEVGERQMEEEE